MQMRLLIGKSEEAEKKLEQRRGFMEDRGLKITSEKTRVYVVSGQGLNKEV